MYVVSYTGGFGFIKPFSAVRDGETQSQQFLTPSIVEGMRLKLGVAKILRHKLAYTGLSLQQEVTQPKGWLHEQRKEMMSRAQSIIKRNVLLNPSLSLAFETKEDAEAAYGQHICLCRNEDMLLPFDFAEMSEEDFDSLFGFELRFTDADAPDAIMVGYNRYENSAPMFGVLTVNEINAR